MVFSACAETDGIADSSICAVFAAEPPVAGLDDECVPSCSVFCDTSASSPPPPPATEMKSQSPGAQSVHLPTGGAGGAPLIMAEDESTSLFLNAKKTLIVG